MGPSFALRANDRSGGLPTAMGGVTLLYRVPKAHTAGTRPGPGAGRYMGGAARAMRGPRAARMGSCP